MWPVSRGHSVAKKSRATTDIFLIRIWRRSKQRRRRSTRFANRSVNCRQRFARRLEADYRLSAYDADVLVNQGRGVVDYYIEVAERAAIRSRPPIGLRKTCCERSKNRIQPLKLSGDKWKFGGLDR